MSLISEIARDMPVWHDAHFVQCRFRSGSALFWVGEDDEILLERVPMHPQQCVAELRELVVRESVMPEQTLNGRDGLFAYPLPSSEIGCTQCRELPKAFDLVRPTSPFELCAYRLTIE